jgi:hypothetical protein
MTLQLSLPTRLMNMLHCKGKYDKTLICRFPIHEWRQPKWRSLSYHIEYDSLLRRWGDLINALPTEQIRKPNVISSKASGICTLGLQYVEH